MSAEEITIGAAALCKRLSEIVGSTITVGHLSRLRMQYPDRIGLPLALPGRMTGWNEGHITALVQVIQEERRCR